MTTITVHTDYVVSDGRVVVTLEVDGKPEELRRALASLTSGRESPEHTELMAHLVLVLARAVTETHHG